MEIVKGQIANDLETQRLDLGYWMGAISRLTYRGVSLDEVQNEPEAVAACTGDEVRDAFGRYYRPEATFVMESLMDDVSVEDIEKEFELEDLWTYYDRSRAMRKEKLKG